MSMPVSTMPGILCGLGPTPSPVNCHSQALGQDEAKAYVTYRRARVATRRAYRRSYYGGYGYYGGYHPGYYGGYYRRW